MRYIVLILSLSLLTTVATAQTLDDCHLSIYTEHEGLSQGRVTSIAQDQDGVLWIGTWDGLNRFDGYNFTTYKATPSNHEPLAQNRFDYVSVNTANDIWCVGRSRFCLFQTQKQHFIDVQSLLEEKYNRVVSALKVIVLENGHSWLIDDDGTLFCVEDGNIDNIEIFPNPSSGARKVYEIRLDSEGNEWLLTDKGVTIVGNLSFKNNLSYKNWAENDGVIWLGTPTGIVSFYSLATRELSFVENMPYEVSHLNQMQLINDSTILMQTNAGVVLINTHTRKSELVKLPTTGSQDVVYCFNNEDSRCCLISGDKKLYLLDAISRRIQSILLPKEGLLWSDFDLTRPFFFKNGQNELFLFFRESGLYKVDLERLMLQPYIMDYSVSLPIRSITQDRQENIWIACDVGLCKLQFGNGEVLPHPYYMKGEIRTLFSDSKGRTWVCNKDGVVEIWEGDKSLGYLNSLGRIVERADSFGVAIYSLFEDRSHNLWLGTRGEGLYRLRYQSPRQYAITGHYKNDSRNGHSLSGDAIYDILQDFKGRLWVGCYDSGLNMIPNPDAEDVLFLHENNHLGTQSKVYPQKVRCLAETSDSIILVGTTHGLYTFNENFTSPEDIHYHRSVRENDDPNSLGGNDIMGIEVTHGGDVYLAVYGGGLNKVLTKDLLSDDKKFLSFTKQNGSYSDVAINLIEDFWGYIWVQTDHMLMRFDPQKESFENIGYGSFPKYAKLSENRPLIDKNGHLLVSTTVGVYVVNPGKIDNNRYVPPIVFGGHIDSLVLKPKEKTLSVSFAAIDFSSSLPIWYAYKLQGIDKDWKITQENLTASYVNLPVGTFYLRVKSTNRNGLWVDNERILPITRKPLFYETPWAICLYVFVAVVLLALIIFIYLRIYKLRYNLRLEHRLTEAKLRFFTDVSHELRTPLTLVEGPLSEVLADENLPDEDRKYLTVVQTNAHRMLNLINQILDFRKIQNEKMRLLIERMNVRESLESLMENFENIARLHNIDFRLEMGLEEVYVWADRDKFEKIFINLLSNAFKYTPQGKSITVQVESDDKEVRIAVCDQGVGISASKIPTLFQRFDTILKDNLYMQSTGIGLSLVKQLVDLHHATITVQSKKEEGSTFEVTFLLGKAHFEDDAQSEFLMDDSVDADDFSFEEENEEEEGDADDRFSILVVEDNDDLRAFLQSCLHRTYRVYMAVNGEDGWQQTLEYLPDLVITDLMMPVLDGFALAERIKADATTCHIPIVVLTAKDTLDDRIRGSNSGIAEYMVKPFSTQLLKARVAMILQQQQQLCEKYMEQFSQRDSDESGYSLSDLSIMPADQQFMQKLMAYIEEHIENPDLSVDDLAQEMALSRSVFFRKMKALVGYSPINFLQTVRIKRAIQFMKTKNFSVAEVAYKVGYADPKYFSRSFKKITGKSPSVYLREI